MLLGVVRVLQLAQIAQITTDSSGYVITHIPIKKLSFGYAMLDICIEIATGSLFDTMR